MTLLLSLVIVGVFGGSFVALAALVWQTGGLVDLDLTAHRLRRSERADALLADGATFGFSRTLRPQEVVHLGSKMVVVPVAFGLALLALVWRDRIGALVAIAGPVMTGALTQYVLKPLINHPEGARAFPSGHAGGIAAIALVVVVLVFRRWGWLLALLVTPVVAVPTLLVGAALLRLDFHYPTDVLGGVILAATVVLGQTVALTLYRGPGHRLILPTIDTQPACSATQRDLQAKDDEDLVPRRD